MPEDIPGGDMSACMALMQEDGHDEDAAARICETLSQEAKADHGNVDELRDALERGRGLIADVGVELNSAVDRPAIDSEWVMFKSVDDGGDPDHDTQIDAPLVLRKADDDAGREEKRIAYAPAMIPREVDKEGDVVGTATVERSAHDYLKNDGGADSDHDLIDGKGEPVESWILPEAKAWDTPGGETKEYPAGTWMVGIEWDQETWKRIQEGDLEGLSIYGKADHVALKGAESGATTKSDDGAPTEQDSPMSDPDIADRVDTIEASVSEVKETVESIKDAVDTTDKRPGDGDGAMIRNIAAELANREDVAANAETIASDLKEQYLDAGKEDGEMDGDDPDGDEEDDDVDVTVENEDGSDDEEDKTSKSADGENPNFGKAGDGSDSAAVAKEATQGGGGVPSYRAAAENEGDL